MTASLRSFAPALVALALHLSACAAPLSPDAQCFAAATADYRAAWREARTLRADLDRGYALHRQIVPRPRVVSCRASGRLDSCLAISEESLALPVAIDGATHARKLAALEARMDALRPAAMKRAAPCGFGDWAGSVEGIPG